MHTDTNLIRTITNYLFLLQISQKKKCTFLLQKSGYLGMKGAQAFMTSSPRGSAIELEEGEVGTILKI